MKKTITWIKETYSLPTQPGWIGLMLAICLTVLYLDSLV